MSTRTPPVATVPVPGRLEIPDDPDDVFDDVVAGNPLVCQRCYCRLRRERPFIPRVGERAGDLLTFVDVEFQSDWDWQLSEREYYEREVLKERLDEVAPPDVPAASGETSACWNCGAVEHYRSPPDTRSRSEAITAAAGVSQTLSEYSVPHNWPMLFAMVGELKTRPSTAGNDHECFRRAVDAAIRRHPEDLADVDRPRATGD
jgi:hypothetical protein